MEVAGCLIGSAPGSLATRPQGGSGRRGGGMLVPRAAAAGGGRGSSSPSSSTPRAPRLVAGPSDPPPDYGDIDANPINRFLFGLFLAKVEEVVGRRGRGEGYDRLVDVVEHLNRRAGATPASVQAASREILLGLFPSFLLPAFRASFARYLPGFSASMNAYATALSCEWLMGPCKVEDVEVEVDGATLLVPSVKVERCRYLEAAGCASICTHSCRRATEQFFNEDMGVPVSLQPDFEDYSCVFKFGVEPEQTEESPCLAGCPLALQPKDPERCPGLVE